MKKSLGFPGTWEAACPHAFLTMSRTCVVCIFMVHFLMFRRREVPVRRLALLLPLVLACSSSPWRAFPPDGGSRVVINLQGDSSVALPSTDGGTSISSGPHGATFISVSAGSGYTCGVETDGTIACWGDNTYGQSTPPAGTFTSVSAGSDGACGVKTDGTIACWGNSTFGEATPPAGTFASVSVDGDYACGVRKDGSISCWETISIPPGTTPPPWPDAFPAPLDASASAPYEPPAGIFNSVSAGAYACGVKTDGTLACWGVPLSAQPPPSAGVFASVSVGDDASACAVRTDGTVACWGGSDPPPAGTFSSVSVGDLDVCGVRTDGTIACSSPYQPTPPAGTFTSVSVGYDHACALRTDGTIACWAFLLPMPSPPF